MLTSAEVCVDPSVAVKIVVAEAGSLRTRALFGRLKDKLPFAKFLRDFPG